MNVTEITDRYKATRRRAAVYNAVHGVRAS